MKIEKNIPLPKNTKYPFHEMEVGDSLLLEGETSWGRAATMARNYGCKNDKKFVTRKEGSGVRIWRTA